MASISRGADRRAWLDWRRLATFVVLVAALGLAPASSRADPAAEALTAYARDQTLSNVVRISLADGRGGAGTIIGREGDTLWVATAAHVVFPDLNAAGIVRPTPAEGIKVFTRDRLAAWTLAGAPVWGGGDIAFLPVAVPVAVVHFDAWRELVVETDPPPGASVQLASTAGAIAFAPTAGTVRWRDGRYAVDALEGRAGQSGAPVFAGRGLIGMYVTSLGERIIPMAQIEAAARIARVPWVLQTYPQRPAPVRLCVTVRGAERSTLRINGPAGLTAPGSDGCFSAASGMNGISATELYLDCTPRSINLPRTPEQSLAVECASDPTGIWFLDGTNVQVQRIGETSWRVEQLPSSAGWLTLTLTKVGEMIQANGTTAIGQPVNGQGQLQARKLSLKIILPLETVTLELTR